MPHQKMEGPIYQGSMPFRPVPVYSQLLHGAPVRTPAPQYSITPSQCQSDNLALTKHLNLISQMNHLRALREFQFGQLTRPGTLSHNHVLQDMNKFSVKNIGQSIESERSHAMVQSQKVLTDEQRKSVEGQATTSRLENSTASISENADVKDKLAMVERIPLPVMFSCGTPYASQYGYGRKVFPCPQCRYTTDRRNNLKRHMLTMHQTCTKTLECCGIMFATKSSLREHAMIFHYHGYTCFYCGRRFCRKALLKRHLSVHNGQKDFVCPVCDYATSHKSNLERHRKVHCRPELEGKQDDDEGRLNGELWKSKTSKEDGQRMRTGLWRPGDDCNTAECSNRTIASDSGDDSEEMNVEDRRMRREIWRPDVDCNTVDESFTRTMYSDSGDESEEINVDSD